MNKKSEEYYDPYREMSYYQLDCPTEEEQFRFVEAMEYLIENSGLEEDSMVFSYNLAMYYRDIKDFRLERKYLEKCEELGCSISGDQLGLIWFYGLGMEPDYKKAFQYFDDSESRLGKIMLSDMYRYGRYAKKDREKCREILEELMSDVECEKDDERFYISTLFPEIALRLSGLNIEDEIDTDYDFDNLLYARIILSTRQSKRPFWGNIELMGKILETIVSVIGNEYEIIDFYDLLVFDIHKATVFFEFEGVQRFIDIFEDDNETVFQFDDKWYHGPNDFLEKSRIENRRLTSIYDQIYNIEIIEQSI
ncbi:MAG: hypothetical protein K6G75_05975 [Lachnospiraceae bacterium]|nr:hypothetical protein [Lachnospiraceae bacterium]